MTAFFSNCRQLVLWSFCLLGTSCGVWEEVEISEVKITISSETEALLKVNDAITWQEADPEVRCHFIHSASCLTIEEEKGKIYSHLNRCGKDADYEFTQDGGQLYLLTNVSVLQAKDIDIPKKHQVQSGLRYSGLFMFTSEAHRIYDVADKRLSHAGEGTGFPANTFSVWYQENPISKEGRWYCDLCEAKRFKFTSCSEVENLLKFIGYQ